VRHSDHFVFDSLRCETRLVWSVSRTLLVYGFSLANRRFSLGLLPRPAEQIVVVLVPPLALMFLVLGAIFLGIATPPKRRHGAGRRSCRS